MSTSIQRVEALLKELGIDDRVHRLGDNAWALKKGSATVQIIAAPEFVVATSKVAEKQPEQDREGFYRMLLQANVQLLGAFFTLEQNGSIRINQVLPVDWLQDKELAFIIGNVATRADEWDDKIAALVAPAGATDGKKE